MTARTFPETGLKLDKWCSTSMLVEANTLFYLTVSARPGRRFLRQWRPYNQDQVLKVRPPWLPAIYAIREFLCHTGGATN